MATSTIHDTMDSIIGTGLRGIQTGLQNAARDADRVVKAFSPESNEEPTEAIVALQADQRQVEASAQVVKVGDRMLGSILDILG